MVIPTRDRADDLARCVESVLACDYPRFEVLVMDQSRPPAALGDDARLRIIALDTVGKSVALNAAMPLIRGEIVAYTDDDCTVPRDWLTRGVETLQAEPGAGVLFGALIPEPHDESRMYIPRYEPPRYIRLSTRRDFIRSPGQAGANLFIRREAAERLGGFDPRLGPGTALRSSEDPDLCFRALQAGIGVVVNPAVRVLHHGGRSLMTGEGQRLLRGYEYGSGAVDAKHLRCGDLWAGLHFLETTRRLIWTSIRSMVLRRRLTGVGLLAYAYLGFFRGLGLPIDRRRRVFTE